MLYCDAVGSGNSTKRKTTTGAADVQKASLRRYVSALGYVRFVDKTRHLAPR